MKKINKMLSYTAGYVDGDGCLYLGKTIQKPKNIIVYEYSVQIVSVKIKVLESFQEFFGGFVRKKPFKPRHRDAYCWTIKGQRAVAVCEKILTYLVDKKSQAKIFIQFGQLISSNDFRVVTKPLASKRNNLIKDIRKERTMHFVTREEIESLNNVKNTVIPTNIDYPYMAGLIDSEGCFRVKKWKPKNKPNNVYCISVEIGNTRIVILRWLIERFGGSISYIPAKKNQKSSATWSISAAALCKILPKIRKYLIIKQEVCDMIIEFQKTILKNGGDRHSKLFNALFEKRIEVRERIIREIQEFNRKGVH